MGGKRGYIEYEKSYSEQFITESTSISIYYVILRLLYFALGCLEVNVINVKAEGLLGPGFVVRNDNYLKINRL